MAKATYWHRGEAIDYKNTTANVIEAGDVIVIGTKIGVAGCDIAPNETGSAHMMGVFALPKGSGAILPGALVKWDAATGTAGTTGIDAGYATFEAKASDPVVYVSINA